jgi:hypothetical protein
MIVRIAVAATALLATGLSGVASAGGVRAAVVRPASDAARDGTGVAMPPRAGKLASPQRATVVSTADLGDIAALSPTDAWGVGSFCVSHCSGPAPVDHTLIMHWDGTAWSQVASPNRAASSSYLTGVAADSPADVWAVGSYITNKTSRAGTLAMHWDGTAWSRVTIPSPGKHGSFLEAVTAVSPTDAWAVGYAEGSARQVGLVLHWDGTAWSKVTIPSPGPASNYLYDVDADSPADAWAVGTYTNHAGLDKTLVVHWNGTAWSRVASPSPGKSGATLNAVTAISATSAWAVGDYCPASGGCTGAPQLDTLVLQWNGTAWSQAASPSPGYANLLNDVSFYSATGGWAVGTYGKKPAGASKTLILGWNGTTWSQVKSPNSASRNNVLYYVSADSATDAWATGSVFLHWDGTSWSSS